MLTRRITSSTKGRPVPEVEHGRTMFEHARPDVQRRLGGEQARSNNVRARAAGCPKKAGRGTSTVGQCPSTRGRMSREGWEGNKHGRTMSEHARGRGGDCQAWAVALWQSIEVAPVARTLPPLTVFPHACSNIVRPRFLSGPPTARARTLFDRVSHLDLRLRVLEHRSTAFPTWTSGYACSNTVRPRFPHPLGRSRPRRGRRRVPCH
jgi:hypothetical protein